MRFSQCISMPMETALLLFLVLVVGLAIGVLALRTWGKGVMGG